MTDGVVLSAEEVNRFYEKLKREADACGYIPKPINTRTFVEQVIKIAVKNVDD